MRLLSLPALLLASFVVLTTLSTLSAAPLDPCDDPEYYFYYFEECDALSATAPEL
jgi:hypothetical protein